MGKVVLYIILSLCFQLSAQEVNKKDAKGLKQGPWEKRYEKSIAYEYKGQFKDDKPYGTFYYYYFSNKKKAIIVHNEKTGRSVANMYYENGLDMAFGIYLNQKKDSVWTYWNSYGKLSYKETYKAGKLNGLKTVYYVPEAQADKSVKVAMTENYVDDVLHGEQIEYFNDGTIKSKGKYENGLKVGKFVVNNSNGTPMIKENYKKGKLHGYSYGYDESGKELGKRFYKEGKELKGKELEKYLKYCKDNKIDFNK